MDGYPGLSKKAPAGTKRLGNLVRSLKWSVLNIDHYLLEEANKEVEKLKGQGKKILCLWDGSVLEKPESRSLEGIAPVLSSKAKRMNRSRKGLLFNMPQGRPIRVMGMEWTGVLIAGLEGIPKVAVMSWWTTKGIYAEKLREKEEQLLRICVRKWGNLPTYVFDRGYASGPWLLMLEKFRVKFIIRWIKKHIFVDTEGKEKKLWEIGRGKRYLIHKMIRDTTNGLKVTCDLWWTPIRHPKCGEQLYLIKARVQGKVCSLITNERVKTEEKAWEIFFCYKRRWQIETSFRYGKCE